MTGATGFIGRFLVARLLERGGTVYALVRKGSLKKLEEMRTHFSWEGRRQMARGTRELYLMRRVAA